MSEKKEESWWSDIWDTASSFFSSSKDQFNKAASHMPDTPQWLKDMKLGPVATSIIGAVVGYLGTSLFGWITGTKDEKGVKKGAGFFAKLIGVAVGAIGGYFAGKGMSSSPSAQAEQKKSTLKTHFNDTAIQQLATDLNLDEQIVKTIIDEWSHLVAQQKEGQQVGNAAKTAFSQKFDGRASQQQVEQIMTAVETKISSTSDPAPAPGQS